MRSVSFLGESFSSSVGREMGFELEKMAIPKWLMLVLVIVAITIAASVWYYLVDPNAAKTIGILGGFISGFMVFLLTFVVSIRPYQRLDRYEKMGVKGILDNRHDKDYYAGILKKAEKTVRVMGASCTRFVDDFLDTRSDDKVLIDALREHRGLSIQLLIPDNRHISEHAKVRIPMLMKKLDELAGEFGSRVELRRFSNGAHHSFVIADGELIAGPVFEGDTSKYAPAIHISMSSRFAQKFEEHFQIVWDSCEPNG
jgi:hypothetical protein